MVTSNYKIDFAFWKQYMVQGLESRRANLSFLADVKFMCSKFRVKKVMVFLGGISKKSGDERSIAHFCSSDQAPYSVFEGHL